MRSKVFSLNLKVTVTPVSMLILSRAHVYAWGYVCIEHPKESLLGV